MKVIDKKTGKVVRREQMPVLPKKKKNKKAGVVKKLRFADIDSEDEFDDLVTASDAGKV